ncbi:MAG: phosphate ABC transporter permease subunit PstC [Dehalococcoidia bacterium]
MRIAAPNRLTVTNMVVKTRAAFSQNPGDVIFKGLALMFTLGILLLAALLVVQVITGSLESIREFGFFQFIVSTEWNPVSRQFGALHVLVGTLVSSLIAVVLAVPVAVGIALFITEVGPRWMRGPVGFLVDVLAAIPSIVFGLWGAFVMLPWLLETVNPFLVDNFGWIPIFEGPSYGVSLFAAGIILAVMIVPIISAVAREIIYQVPQSQKEGMIAIGATRWETVWKVILPYARTGIIGGVILGLARAIGETMAVTMVIGNRTELTWSILQQNATMASLIANEFREATYDLYVSSLIHVGLVLMIVALLVNILARLLVWSVVRGPSVEGQQ